MTSTPSKQGENIDTSNNDEVVPELPSLEGNLTKSRFSIYKDKIIESLKSGGNTDTDMVKVKAKLPENDDKKDEIVEEILVTYKSSDGKNFEKNIELTCNVCYDDEFTPCELIEYTFDDKKWYLSNACKDCIVGYRSMKFKNWKDSIENPTCEAAFKRMLKLGVITHMFDKMIFPSPEDEEHLYQVHDDKGKVVDIPRPVSGMRIWKPIEKEYENVCSRLDGAPETKEECEKLWKEMIETFNRKYGQDVIDSWLNAPGKANNTEKI